MHQQAESGPPRKSVTIHHDGKSYATEGESGRQEHGTLDSAIEHIRHLFEGAGHVVESQPAVMDAGAIRGAAHAFGRVGRALEGR
jgi:hypothetical protein